MKTAAVEATNITKRYRRPERTIEVLRGIDFRVQSGEWVALTGASGCGKTTLLHVIGALDNPSDGEIAYFGKKLSGMNPFQRAKLRRRHIGFIFQSYQLLPDLTAWENVLLPGRLAKQPAKELESRARGLLDRLGMQERLKHRPAELSGGEQQRIAIARALINQPEVILADEPTGNLDPRNAEAIMEILGGLRKDEGKTIIMVTHDRKLAQEHADRVLVLQDGTLSGK